VVVALILYINKAAAVFVFIVWTIIADVIIRAADQQALGTIPICINEQAILIIVTIIIAVIPLFFTNLVVVIIVIITMIDFSMCIDGRAIIILITNVMITEFLYIIIIFNIAIIIIILMITLIMIVTIIDRDFVHCIAAVTVINDVVATGYIVATATPWEPIIPRWTGVYIHCGRLIISKWTATTSASCNIVDDVVVTSYVVVVAVVVVAVIVVVVIGAVVIVAVVIVVGAVLVVVLFVVIGSVVIAVSTISIDIITTTRSIPVNITAITIIFRWSATTTTTYNAVTSSRMIFIISNDIITITRNVTNITINLMIVAIISATLSVDIIGAYLVLWYRQIFIIFIFICIYIYIYICIYIYIYIYI
jgi:hypothetical protein